MLGLLSGATVALGNHAFTVTASDALGCTVSSNYTLVIRPLPTLGIANTANSVVLSWLTNYPDFRLIAALEIPSADWSAVSAVPVVSGNKYVVTNAPAGLQKFYRLRTP